MQFALVAFSNLLPAELILTYNSLNLQICRQCMDREWKEATILERQIYFFQNPWKILWIGIALTCGVKERMEMWMGVTVQSARMMSSWTFGQVPWSTGTTQMRRRPPKTSTPVSYNPVLFCYLDEMISLTVRVVGPPSVGW